MPKSDFWKFDSSNGPEPWIRNTREESQKIDSMTSDELIDYIKNFTLAPPAASDIRNLFESLRFRTLEYGNGLIYYAQDIFILEMQQLLNKLKYRLKNFEKKLDIITLRNHFNDTKMSRQSWLKTFQHPTTQLYSWSIVIWFKNEWN